MIGKQGSLVYIERGVNSLSIIHVSVFYRAIRYQRNVDCISSSAILNCQSHTVSSVYQVVDNHVTEALRRAHTLLNQDENRIMNNN